MRSNGTVSKAKGEDIKKELDKKTAARGSKLTEEETIEKGSVRSIRASSCLRS